MPEMFTTAEVDYNGAIHAQKGIINSPSFPSLGVLMQNMQLQYSQQITRLYELGKVGLTTNAYYVAGRAQGQLQVAHVIGPKVALKEFYKKYSDVCKARDNNLILDLGPNTCQAQGTPGKMKYTAKSCVITQIGMSVSVQDFLINANASLMFIGLDVD